MDHDAKKAAYECDITYITNNELGFDYLRDNMVIYKEQLVMRDLNYAIGSPVEKEIKAAMSNSLGFGGHNATILIQKYEA